MLIIKDLNDCILTLIATNLYSIKLKMDISLAQKAISFALHGEWEEAIKANLEILKLSPNDVDALNRLAKAYAEVGRGNLAKDTSQKVLDIDPINPIALRCLDKWKSTKFEVTPQNKPTNTQRHEFIEESGKTKLVLLLHPGETSLLATLDSGDEVKLLTHPHSVSVLTIDDKYIGKLPDDLAARLRTLIKSGNKYQTLIKSVIGKDVTVFIKEIEKSESLKNSTSFPTEKIEYVSFTPPELVHKDEPLLEVSENVTQD